MLYRPYGDTGEICSVLGFGGMRFRDIDDRDACIEAVVEAARGGVNYFDTAPAYFGVKSETVFGEAFDELRRRSLPFLCSTKTFASDEKAIRGELEAQLRRLHVEAIDFYHIWCILTADEWRRRTQAGVLRTFRRLKEEGLVRHVCVSSHLAGAEIEDLLGEEGIEGVLFGYSAYDAPRRERALVAVRERGLGCVVMNPLAGGLIPQHPERFAFVKERPDQDVVEAALHFIWAHPEITTALVGFSDRGEVLSALAAVDAFRGVDEAAVARVRGAMGEGLQQLCTGCQYCDHCPEGVPVPQLMDVHNHLQLVDRHHARIRLEMQWGLKADVAGRCSACGECEQSCTQHLPIIERLREVAGLAG